MLYIHDPAQDRGNSSVLALELSRFLTKPWIWKHTDSYVTTNNNMYTQKVL